MEYLNVMTLVGLATSSFIATNMDNLLLLVLLQGANPLRRGIVLLGYLGAVAALICVSALGVAVGEVLDAGLVGFLGLVPIVMGCHMLYQSWKDRGHPEEPLDTLGGSSRRGLWFGTLALMLSNSSDSLAVMLPLLADTGHRGQWILVSSYLVCALLWAGLAWKIAGQRALALRIERQGEKVVPWIMIGVGLYILLDTATDTLL